MFATGAGLVVVNSCSHAGLPVILEEVAARFPGRPIRAFVGGLHMRGQRDGREVCAFTAAQMQALADAVRRHGVQAVYTGHCTGCAGYAALEPLLGGSDASALHRGCAGFLSPLLWVWNTMHKMSRTKLRKLPKMDPAHSTGAPANRGKMPAALTRRGGL